MGTLDRFHAGGVLRVVVRRLDVNRDHVGVVRLPRLRFAEPLGNTGAGGDDGAASDEKMNEAKRALSVVTLITR